MVRVKQYYYWYKPKSRKIVLDLKRLRHSQKTGRREKILLLVLRYCSQEFRDYYFLESANNNFKRGHVVSNPNEILTSILFIALHFRHIVKHYVIIVVRFNI